jgi:hypothetical protein
VAAAERAGIPTSASSRMLVPPPMEGVRLEATVYLGKVGE